MKSRACLLAACAWLFASPPSLHAQPQTPVPARPGVHEHDGFMARLTAGFGSGFTRETGSDSVGELERERRGFAGSLSLDIGGSPSANLVLHGRLAEHTIASPSLTLDGRELGTARRASVTAYLLGPGATYYLMPLNAYATVAVGLSGLRFEDADRNEQYTRVGMGLNVDVGKEWWISADVGLGAALRFWFSHAAQRIPDIALDSSHDYFGWALLGSFTWQ